MMRLAVFTVLQPETKQMKEEAQTAAFGNGPPTSSIGTKALILPPSSLVTRRTSSMTNTRSSCVLFPLAIFAFSFVWLVTKHFRLSRSVPRMLRFLVSPSAGRCATSTSITTRILGSVRGWLMMYDYALPRSLVPVLPGLLCSRLGWVWSCVFLYYLPMLNAKQCPQDSTSQYIYDVLCRAACHGCMFNPLCHAITRAPIAIILITRRMMAAFECSEGSSCPNNPKCKENICRLTRAESIDIHGIIGLYKTLTGMISASWGQFSSSLSHRHVEKHSWGPRNFALRRRYAR